MYFQLNILANFIISEYFNSSNCLLIFNGHNTRFEYTGNLPFVISTIYSEIPEDVVFKYHGCQGIVISSENPRKIFENFEKSIKLKMERFNFRRYLILPTKNSSNLEIFDSESIKFVSDLLVVEKLSCVEDNYKGILRDNRVIFGLYTHQYGGEKNDSGNVVEVDNWFSNNETFLWNKNLFPDKLQDQMGRELEIATFTYQPYSIPAKLDGTEILVALEFASRYNMTPKFIIDEDGMWGEIFDNWTGYGILGNLVADRGDVGIGSLYTWGHAYHFLDFTKPTIRTGVTCLAPAPKTVGGWITPFICFSWRMWVMMLVSFLMACVAIFGATTFDPLKKNRRKGGNVQNLMKSLLLTLEVFLLQGISNISRSSNVRIIFALTLLLSLMTATLYSSGLASNMTVPRYSGTIDNVQDLVRSEVRWGANSIAWTASLLDDNSHIYRKAVDCFYAGTYEEMVEKNKDTFAFSIERLHGGHYALGGYITSEGVQRRRLMGEDIYWDFCLVMLRKSSILLPKWDEMLLEITQTGLPYFWEYQVNVRNADMKLQEAVKYSARMPRPDKTKLSFTHVEGAFALWAVGIFFSIVAFVCEIWRYKK